MSLFSENSFKKYPMQLKSIFCLLLREKLLMQR